MILKEAYHQLRQKLSGIYDSREASAIADRVLEAITGWDRTARLLHHENEMEEAWVERYQTCVTELMNGRPMQYVVGHAWFCGLDFKVDERVLIPRPETEELVDWITETYKNMVPDKDLPFAVLDIGTGSGCIAIALKTRFPEWCVDAMDKSEAALGLAAENANRLSAHIHTIQADILSEADDHQKQGYSLMVSNPPYIPPTDKEGMEAHVVDHEPHMALFTTDNDPLEFYHAIVAYARHHLLRGGRLFFETHMSYAHAVAKLMEENEFEGIVVSKDMQGRDRMVCGTRMGASL